jgi:hypothetical protein
MYYHATQKTLARNPRPDDLLDAPRYALTLWTPQRRHEEGDPYHAAQQGHLARVTLTQWTPGGTSTVYDVHQTKTGITATITRGARERRMSISELETIASIARQELQDYDQPTTRLGRAIETITHYRRRTKERLQGDLNNIVNDYYAQEAGRSIRIQ